MEEFLAAGQSFVDYLMLVVIFHLGSPVLQSLY